MKRISSLVFLVWLLLAGSALAATTVTIGDNTGNTFSGTEDTKIKSANATTNFGSDASYHVALYALGDHYNVLIKFSGLSNITGPVTVSSATLNVWVEGSTATDERIGLYRLFRDWVEAQATWNIYSTGNSWTTAGALSDGNDKFVTSSVDLSVDFTSTGAYVSWTSAQLATDVQNIINGSASNFGWLLLRNDGGADDSQYKLFTSSEGADTNRPYLDITYTASASTSFSNRRRGQ